MASVEEPSGKDAERKDAELSTGPEGFSAALLQT